jgi:hypothetical protein
VIVYWRLAKESRTAIKEWSKQNMDKESKDITRITIPSLSFNAVKNYIGYVGTERFEHNQMYMLELSSKFVVEVQRFLLLLRIIRAIHKTHLK